MKKVCILRITTYDAAAIRSRVEQTITEHFPLASEIEPGKKILLKPNLLMAAEPSDAVTTHPAVIEAIGRYYQGRGHAVAIADSPGGFISQKEMDTVYATCGITAVAQRCGFELLYPERSIIQQGMPLCWWSQDKYTLINLPKLKTHEIMVMTLATKNLYGCVSGLHKSLLHRDHPTTDDFSSVILKLNALIQPALHIVDGILSLEGDGPSKKGTPRKINAIIIGDNALAVDWAISQFVGLSATQNPLLANAKKIDQLNESEVEIISDFEAGTVIPGFKFPKPFILNTFPPFLLALFKRLLRFYPHIDTTKCTACAVCVSVCPQKAITISAQKASINRARCIMCMCCGEMCRFGAIDIEKNLFIKTASFVFQVITSIKKCLPRRLNKNCKHH